MKKPITPVLREPSKTVYTKKEARKLVHVAFKAGLINTYQARPDHDLSGQNSRLFALKQLFPRIFTEGQPGHITREQEEVARYGGATRCHEISKLSSLWPREQVG